MKGTTNTPIEKELHHILGHPVKRHVILIDDAHCFTGQDDYPTLQELRNLIGSTCAYASIQVRNDIIAVSQNRILSEIPVYSKTPEMSMFEALGQVYYATLFPSISVAQRHLAHARSKASS